MVTIALRNRHNLLLFAHICLFLICYIVMMIVLLIVFSNTCNKFLSSELSYLPAFFRWSDIAAHHYNHISAAVTVSGKVCLLHGTLNNVIFLIELCVIYSLVI